MLRIDTVFYRLAITKGQSPIELRVKLLLSILLDLIGIKELNRIVIYHLRLVFLQFHSELLLIIGASPLDGISMLELLFDYFSSELLSLPSVEILDLFTKLV